MSQLFVCPHCGTKTIVEPEFAGKSGPCVECGRNIFVPLENDQTNARAAMTVPPIRKHSAWPLIISIFFLVLLGAAVVAIFVASVAKPTANKIAKARRSALSASNLVVLTQALRAYEKLHGRFPPAIVKNETGQLMHSWRVLILPQLGRQDLYQKYDFSKPWDDSTNLALVNQMPLEFASPDDPNAGMIGATNYYAITGDRSLFADGQGTKLNKVSDGLKNTLALIEVDNSVTSWTQPVDFDHISRRLTDGSPARNRYLAGGSLVATADGKTHVLKSSITPQDLQALSTIAGGEPHKIVEHSE